MPLVLRRRRVRADEQDAPLAPMGVRRPHLLARDAEGVAVEHRASVQPGEIGSRPWLREALAPDVVGGEDRGEESLPLRLGPPLHDPGARQHEADGVHTGRGSRPHHLLLEDHLVDQARAPPAVSPGPGDPHPPAAMEPLVPRQARVERPVGVEGELVVGGGPIRAVSGELALEPSPQLGAEGFLVRREREVHGQAVW